MTNERGTLLRGLSGLAVQAAPLRCLTRYQPSVLVVKTHQTSRVW